MNASGVDKNSKEYRELQREIVETESKLKNFRNQLLAVGNAKLTALSQQFKAVGAAMMSAGRTMTTYITLPLVAAGTVAVKKFAEVDKTMQLTNSTMGNTKEEADKLNQAMKKAAAQSTFGMSDAATATLNFARAGLDAEQAANALAPAMALAAGEGGELDTVSNGLVATINGFHGSFADAAKYADVFANACNNSALDVNSLSTAMSIAAPIFSAAGYSVNDAALYMGVMANAGIEANKAANSLKTGLARLVSPPKEAADKMKELGISIVNADGTMKNSTEIQKELHDAFKDLSDSEKVAAASAIFGKNQMAPWLALIGESPKKVDALSTALGTEGTAMKMQSDMMGGFAGSLEKLKSGVDVLAASFGEALAPAIEKVATWIQMFVDWFNQLNPQIQSTIATVALVVAALGPVVFIIGAIVSAIGTVLGLISTLNAALPLLIAAIGGIATPVLIVIGVIGALIAIGVLLYKNWDKIRDWASKTWTAITTTIKTAIDNVKKKFNEWRTNIATLVSDLSTKFQTLRNNVVTKATELRDKAVEKFKSLRDKAKTLFDSIREKIETPIKKAKDTVDGAVKKIKGLFPISIGHILSNIKLPHFRWHMKTVVGNIKVPQFDGVSWYAKGGIFTAPTIAGIAEKGNEAVVPLDKFWKKMDAIAENFNSPQVVINIYPSPGMDVKELAAEVEKRLIDSTNRRRKAW